MSRLTALMMEPVLALKLNKFQLRDYFCPLALKIYGERTSVCSVTAFHVPFRRLLPRPHSPALTSPVSTQDVHRQLQPLPGQPRRPCIQSNL